MKTVQSIIDNINEGKGEAVKKLMSDTELVSGVIKFLAGNSWQDRYPFAHALKDCETEIAKLALVPLIRRGSLATKALKNLRADLDCVENVLDRQRRSQPSHDTRYDIGDGGQRLRRHNYLAGFLDAALAITQHQEPVSALKATVGQLVKTARA